jgi:hypothetical protein
LYADLFLLTKGKELPLLRGPNVNYYIKLKLQDRKEPKVLYGPLYNMLRDELLVLRKTLHKLLDKGFIRASSSPTTLLVLFVQKLSRGLRFYVNY